MYPKPGSIKELTERMIDKSSNASRLVDKLIAKNLVKKAKSHSDNRRAEVVITEEGLQLLIVASEKIDELSNGLSSRLSQDEVATLNLFLDNLRD